MLESDEIITKLLKTSEGWLCLECGYSTKRRTVVILVIIQIINEKVKILNLFIIYDGYMMYIPNR